MRLLRDQIVIRPDEADVDPKTTSGIFLPGSQQSPFTTGEVVALGQWSAKGADGTEHPFSVQVGDRVEYARHNGMEYVWHDEKVILTSEQAVVGILEPDLAVV